MFKLKFIRMKNFFSILDASVDLQKPGLYLITGYNEAGGDPNGCGKSSILAGISMALWGRTPTGLRGRDVVNWGKEVEGYEIELILAGPEGDYAITRTSDTLNFTINGKKAGGRKTDIQELINETFHSSYEIFFASTFFTSDMSDYLSKMGDAGKKKLFKAVIGLEALDMAYLKAKTNYETLMQQANDYETQIQLMGDFLESRKNEVTILASQHADYENTRLEELDGLQKQSTSAPKRDENLLFTTRATEVRLKKERERFDTMAKLFSEKDAHLEDVHEKLGGIRTNIMRLSEELREANTLQGSVKCDKCGGNLENFEDHIKHLQTELSDATAQEHTIEEEIERIDRDMQNLANISDGIASLENTLDELYVQGRVEDEQIRTWEILNKGLTERIEKAKNSVNPYADLLSLAREDIATKDAQREVLSEVLAKTSHKIDLVAFLKTVVFSKEGVAAHMIETAFGRLQSLGNKYLSRICTEGLTLHIVPQTELKSKAFKEEIDIYVTSNLTDKKIPFEALSGGQKQRVNIALLFALHKFCQELGKNTFDFIILDEVLDLSLAAKGQSDVVSLLRDLLLREIFQILVVSHKEGISQDFDKEIVVIRGRDGISHVS